MKPLNVLVFEDSERDAELLLRELRKQGFAPESRRVESAAELTGALGTERWDIVLCDYVLPAFSGLAAIKLIGEHDPDMPVIIVSGQIGEDTAVEALRAGARDYFVKGSLKRLGQAIEREMAEAQDRRRRREAEEEIARYHANLENLVNQRTAELAAINEELLRQTDELRQEISDRQKVETALRESEERLRTLCETAPIGVGVSSSDGVLLYANPSYERILGYGAGELVGMKAADLYCNPEDRRSWLGRMEEDGSVRDVETRLKRKDGTTVWVSISVSPVIFGGKQAVVGTIQDITERKETEAEMAYRATFPELNPDPIVELDSDGNVTYMNPAFQVLFPDLPAIGSYLTGLTPLLEGDSVSSLPREIAVGNSWYEQTISRVPGSQNLRIYGRDITDRKKEEARRSRDLDALTRLHALAVKALSTEPAETIMQDVMDAAIAMMQADKGTLQLFENQTLRIVAQYGHQLPFLKFFAAAENVASVCGEATRRGERVVITDVEQSPLFAGTESLSVLRDAGVRSVQSTPLMSRTGQLLGILTTQWTSTHDPDQHDLWRLDLLARQTADFMEREKAEQIKDEFIGMVSHELKTPLTVVMGAIQTAMSEGVSALEARGLLKDAAWGADTMADIVDNLLELSRWQASRLVLQLTPLHVAEVIDTLVERSSGKSGRHRLVADVAGDLPPVRADRIRLERILDNLIDNAIKYSPKGGEVMVSARREGGQLLVSVSDQGIGIAAGDVEKLFQPFARLETDLPGAVKGVGLGLVVCRRLVEAHGGRIWIDSAPGKGATFCFSLPL